MTNDEINSKAAEIAEGFDFVKNSEVANAAEEIAGAIREAVLQAYEEAAREAENEATGLPLDKMPRYDEGYDRASLEIAQAIRELAEPLKSVVAPVRPDGEEV